MTHIHYKLNWISDYLHYPISISFIEKAVISTDIFNRLHNILQNSTAFLTYPSNRTSRFAHSLGVMNISGQMFYYGIVNANLEDFEDFFSQVKEKIERVKRTSDFNRSFLTNYPKCKPEHDPRIFFDPLYLSAIPANLYKEENRYLYIVIYQAIRLAALLHDLGHPPFSHVSEHAILEVYRELEERQLSQEKLTHKQQLFLELVGEVYRKHGNLHEGLSERLAQIVLNRVEKIFTESIFSGLEQNKEQLIYAIYLIREFTLSILNNETPLFEALHSIIASDLDADRLDYVPRDLSMSGLSRDPFKYERLLTSYQMVRRTSNKSNVIFEFMPSVRALSTVEQIFRLRFELYQYVIFHHRVVKTDALLREAIKNLIKEELLAESRDNTNYSVEHLLPMNIQGLWKVFEFVSGHSLKDLVHLYTQWDDSWLLSVLRRYYFEKLLVNDSDNLETSPLKLQLRELLSSEKIYYSVFKRVESFIETDESFLENITFNVNWQQIKVFLLENDQISNLNNNKEFHKQSNNFSADIDPFSIAEKYLLAYQQANGQMLSELKTGYGFFTTVLVNIFKDLGKSKDILPFLSEALDKLKKRYHLSDVIFIAGKQPSSGVKAGFSVVQEGRIIDINKVSSVISELKQRTLFFPPFKLYIYKDNMDTELISQIRQGLGELLADTFSTWLENNHCL